ncbi:hypothetical protein V2G26_016568 [Clonostachys chloroleuca]
MAVNISDALAFALAAFFGMCAQAHVTDKLTPAFAQMVEASLEPLNEKLLWFLGVTTGTLNSLLLSINVVLVSLLVPRPTRRLGLLFSVFFLSIGFTGDIVTDSAVSAHVILISGALIALTLR